MACQRQPLSLYTTALILFGFTAILPLGCMLGQFIVGIIQQPSDVVNIIIDSRQLLLLSRSLLVAFSATLVALGLGLPVAIILAAKDMPLRRLFHLLVLVPMLIPPYVMAGAWIHLLSPAGSVNRVLAACFGPTVKLSLYSTAGCAWCMGISFFPVIAVVPKRG